VAAGLVAVALGSDTAGSLRIPAHCCGVTAWKPSFGCVPAQGSMPLAPSLDCLGFLAQDAAALRPIAAIFAPQAQPIQRIAIAADVLQSCHASITAGIHALANELWHGGFTLGETALNTLIADCDGPVLTLLQGEAARANAALLDSGQLDPTLAARLAKGHAITDDQMQAARDTLAAMDIAAVFGDADAIVLPVMRICTPLVAQCEPGSPDFSARTLYALSALTRWVNGLGLPAVAVPCGFDRDGMPMAAQIVGRPQSDQALLDVAARLQASTLWHGRVPNGIRTTLREDA
jgi:Asp-tRNA(Asn)/Glu-tRNA(Gln) amidotransferase A subunit family amidase